MTTRTLGITENEDGVRDLDGTILTDIQALEERIFEVIQFNLGTWFLDIRRGVDRTLIQGHETTLVIAANTITDAILAEGGDEITSIDTPIVQLDFESRRMTYQAIIHTIYSDSINMNAAL